MFEIAPDDRGGGILPLIALIKVLGLTTIWTLHLSILILIRLFIGQSASRSRRRTPRPPPLTLFRRYEGVIGVCYQRSILDFDEFRAQRGPLRGELCLCVHVASTAVLVQALTVFGWRLDGQPLRPDWDGRIEAKLSVTEHGSDLGSALIAKAMRDLAACHACGVMTISFGPPATQPESSP